MTYSSPNFRDGRFQNQIPTKQSTITSVRSMLKDFICGGQERIPRKPPSMVELQKDAFEPLLQRGLRITWLGHSTTLVEMDGYRILTDPVFGKRTSPVSFMGPRRFHKQFPIAIDELPPIDVVLISHDHYDHLDKTSIQALRHKAECFYVPLGVGQMLEVWGIPRDKIKEFDWWDASSFHERLNITAAPARHFSGRGLHRNTTLWVSWIIASPEHRVYFSGDGGYSPAFKEIGDKYGPFHISMIEAGQYNENWAHIHMLPEESVQAHVDVKGDVMLPLHWATFNLSFHAWTEPIERVLQAASAQGVRVATPRAGEHIQYTEGKIPDDRWWR